MAIFLAVSTSPQGETVLTRVEMSKDLPPGIHAANAGKYRAVIGPFPSVLAAHYIWWLWAKRGVKRLTAELVAAAEQAARDEDDLLWDIERATLLAEEGMTPGERADIAAEYDPATSEPIAVCWPFPAQTQAVR